DLLLEPEGPIGRGGQADQARLDLLETDRPVIEGIGSRRVFRADPEAMPTADHPVRLARAAHLVRVFLEDVEAPPGPETDHARADVEGHDQLDPAIAEPEVVPPSPVSDRLHEMRSF